MAEGEWGGEGTSPLSPPRCLSRPTRLDIRQTGRVGHSDGGDANLPAQGASTRPNHNIKIELQNIGTLPSKLPDIRVDLHQNHPDIVCFTETNLKKTTPDNVLQVPGYRLFRRDRVIGRKKSGGGVAIYIREEIQAELMKTKSSPGDSHLEPLWLKIKLDKKRITLLGGLYRPPSTSPGQIHSDYNHLEEELQSLIAAHPSNRIILAGDMNSDARTNPVAHSRLVELEKYGLHCQINEPTFIRGDTQSILDVIMLSDALCCATKPPDVTVEMCDYAAHHKRVSVSTTVPRAKVAPHYRTARNWRTFDARAFLDNLRLTDWNSVVRSSDSCEQQWHSFSSVMMLNLNEHAPLRRFKVHNPSPPPVSDETLELMDERRSAKTIGDMNTYKVLNVQAKRAIRRDMRNSIKQKVDQSSPASLFHQLKPVIAPKRGHRVNPENLTTDEINDYFVSIGARTRESVMAQFRRSGMEPLNVRLPRVNAGALTLTPVTLDQLKNVIFAIPNKNHCIDGDVPLKILKISFCIVGRYLLRIINTSIVTENVPESWKRAEVLPLYKRNDPSDPTNFRPITIVSSICKIIEKIVHIQLTTYMKDQFLFSNDQHGFLSNHSTSTALLTMTDEIIKGMDRSEISLLALLDLSRCFDVVDHSTILKKLELLQVRTGWFESYLEGHTQRVRVGECLSKSLPISIGCFQGTVLGSLLFNILSNDIASYIPSSINGFHVTLIRYADDTQLAITGPRDQIRDMEKAMEHVLGILSNWFLQNGMMVNAAKTELMVCGDRRQIARLGIMPKVRFMGEDLLCAESVKNLGVIMDSTLSWQPHVKHVINRCFGILIGILHAKHVLPASVLPRIVDSLVISHIRYCTQVYGSASKSVIQELQKVLNFAARVISGRRKYDHVSDVLKGLGWLTVPKLVDYFDLCMMHKILSLSLPTGLRQNLLFNHQSGMRKTRQSSHLSLVRPRNNHGKRTFIYRASKLYNRYAIDNHLHRHSVCSFKRYIIKMLTEAP